MESTSVTQSMSSLRGTVRGDFMELEFIKNGKQCSCYMCIHSDKSAKDEPCCNCIDSIYNPDEYAEVAPCYKETDMRRKYASLAYDGMDQCGYLYSLSKESILARYLLQFDDKLDALNKAKERIELTIKNRFGSAENQCVKAARITLDDAISNYVHMIEGIIQG